MSDRNKLHVTPRDDGWAVKRENAKRALTVLPTKVEAVAKAKAIAKEEQPSQLIIHKKDNTIQTEHTYGSDPFPPPG